MDKNLMIRFDADTGMEFFKRCGERNIANDDIDAKLEIFAEMAREGYPITVMSTNRTKEEVIENLAKHHKKILHIKPKEVTNEEKESKEED